MKGLNIIILSIALSVILFGCKTYKGPLQEANRNTPDRFVESSDTTNVANINWREFFGDENLASLIDTALSNNQELNILLQEIIVSSNEVRARKGEYLPFIGVGVGTGLEKEGLYTRKGAVDDQLEIRPGQEFPEPLGDFKLGAYASWELDIWKKLRNSKKAAAARYLGSIEGKNFLVTNLVAEIAESYFELLALDNSLANIQNYMAIQEKALQVAKQQKDAAKITQLAVNRFEAQWLNTQNLQYAVKQEIVETENHINFLVGRFPQAIERNSLQFDSLSFEDISAGLPAQLLSNRPDIRQAEFELEASKLDVKVARANFFPSFGLKAGIGFQAFNPKFIFNPESLLYNLAGDLMAPLINRNSIKAAYFTAKAQQVQAVIDYEQTILQAFIDVVNQLSKIDNYAQSYNTKAREVQLLTQSTNIANNLFNSARADYNEVLLTQEEALDSKMELIEIKKEQLGAKVNIYRALGGGWK